MNLLYISIGPDIDRTSNEERYDFELRTRFISNYLSRRVRELRFKTDGTFNQIHVSLVEDCPGPSAIRGLDALQVQIKYDRDRYKVVKGKPGCDYYLPLFRDGFRKAADFKHIPLDDLLGLLEEFGGGGCKNEWLHKKKDFKDSGVSIALNCYFTTNHFRLVATIEQLSTKARLCSGVLLETDPDEVCFQGTFKDILIDGDKVIITDAGDSPEFLIDLDSALSGSLRFERVNHTDEKLDGMA